MGKELKPFVGKTCRYLSNVKSAILYREISNLPWLLQKFIFMSCEPATAKRNVSYWSVVSGTIVTSIIFSFCPFTLIFLIVPE
jgi:hypothetical protein